MKIYRLPKVLLLCAALCASLSATAETETVAAKAKNEPAKNSAVPRETKTPDHDDAQPVGGADKEKPFARNLDDQQGSDVQVTLNSSVQHIALGSIYSMSADVKNVSSQPLVVDLASIDLAVHADLAPPSERCVWWYQAGLSPHFDSSSSSLIVLQPSEHIPVFFDLSAYPKIVQNPNAKDDGCQLDFWHRLAREADFQPGDYTFTVLGFYDPDATSKDPARPFSHATQFPVAISQSSIVIFAAFGGILAFLLTAIQGGDMQRLLDGLPVALSFSNIPGSMGSLAKSSRLLLGFLLKLLGAGFMSMSFAIVTARTSDLQFPIKISILDGWGAVTIGFLAFFAGGKFIKSLNDWYQKSVSTSPSAPPPTPPPTA